MGIWGSPSPPPASQASQLQNSTLLKISPDIPPPAPSADRGEEGGKTPTAPKNPPMPQVPNIQLMGPAQPGPQATEASSPSLVSTTAPSARDISPTPKVGPHTVTSSSSAFNAFAPIEPEKEDTQILEALSHESKLLVNQKLDALRESANGILTGVTNFYNETKLIPAGTPGTPKALADPALLNAAFKLVLIALNSGFPNPESEVKTPPVFEGNTWSRAACAVLAAIGQGMIRTSPVCLKATTNSPLNLKGAFFQLPQNVIAPETEGQLIQCLAEQIAGMVNF